MTDTQPKKLLPDEQANLDRCLIHAAMNGTTETVQTLLAAGGGSRIADAASTRGAGAVADHVNIGCPGQTRFPINATSYGNSSVV